MALPTSLPASGGAGSGEILAIDILIASQKSNVRISVLASLALWMLVGFLVLHWRAAESVSGISLKDILPFVPGALPLAGLVNAYSRIGELKAARILACQLSMTTYEQELLRQLLRK